MIIRPYIGSPGDSERVQGISLTGYVKALDCRVTLVILLFAER
jgi:hypothetical protein